MTAAEFFVVGALGAIGIIGACAIAYLAGVATRRIWLGSRRRVIEQQPVQLASVIQVSARRRGQWMRERYDVNPALRRPS